MKSPTKIAKAQIVTWPDGARAINIQWEVGNTTGPYDSTHMQALLARAVREGKPIEKVRW